MIIPFDNYDDTIITSEPTMWDELRLRPIPNNTLINKVLTGWGATYSELEANRNSIILVPNKAQIESKYAYKEGKHYLHPVTEKYKEGELVAHIENANGRHIKFISTPEGLKKLIKAILITGGNPYTDYFILMDECHKLTKDIKFRVNISSCVDDFFCFQNKAMISATPFIPSDPRLQYFKKTKVNHTRGVRKRIDLKIVNNLGAAFKEYIDNYDGEMLFVFFNSIQGIHSLITKFDLKDTKVFCSEDGVAVFNHLGMKTNCYSEITTENLGKINILTSSFFNGLDIKLNGITPDVLILTDRNYVEHTIIDPNTDTYQILGRFRQPDPKAMQPDNYRNATHIVGVRTNKAVKLEPTLLADIDTSRKRYHQIQNLQATTHDPYLKQQVYGEALKRVTPYSNLLNEHGDLDHFKYDNFLYEHQLKLCYCQDLAVGLTYIKSGLFEFTETKKIYLDEDMISMSKGAGRYSKSSIAKVLVKLIANENNQGIDGADAYYQDMCKRFPLITNAVNILGFNEVEQLGTKTRIEAALRKLDMAQGKVSQGIIDAVYSTFIIGVPYEVQYVKEKLLALFAEYGLEANLKATDIRTYFETDYFNGSKLRTAKEIATGLYSSKYKSVRKVKLGDKKFNQIDKNSNRSHNYLEG
ncbi:DEAD/DEAH box helicase family protein [Pedobacter sp. Leaf132]|uniref:DEAD/DEAH box helicase family protein n=1 Tax=Pedobacter sp. Leaf132 TaxID=2876557 RepID=UPI001E4E231C|nr:DEAD/DEAH box helicase family protein [Pedobacter sp. Leaf132]